MIKYKDFTPEVIEKSFGSPRLVESFEALVEDANKLIDSESIQVINFESVTLGRVYGNSEKKRVAFAKKRYGISAYFPTFAVAVKC